jgi:hypothetical protein
MAVAILATIPGWRNPEQATSVPSRTRSVTTDRAARVAKGSMEPAGSSGPPYRAKSRKKWSEIQIESNPSSSARRAAPESPRQVTPESGKEKS